MLSMNFLRVVAGVPEIKVGNPDYNCEKICELWKESAKDNPDIVLLPELTLTGYSCGELFNQKILYESSLEAFKKILCFSKDMTSVLIFGSYLNINNKLYNCAFIIYQGEILAAIPKIHLPNKQEFYEKRWFVSGKDLTETSFTLFDQTFPIGNIILTDRVSGFSFSTEICEDLWSPVPPSSFLYLNGAEIIFNLSSSNAIVGKSEYRKALISQQSARFNGSYVYTSSGVHESTTDYLMDGHSLIAENGRILAENERFQRSSNFITADIDLDVIRSQRLNNSSFAET